MSKEKKMPEVLFTKGYFTKTGYVGEGALVKVLYDNGKTFVGYIQKAAKKRLELLCDVEHTEVPTVPHADNQVIILETAGIMNLDKLELEV